MKILFTGGSSFSGFWISKTLSEFGHDVFNLFTKNSLEEYSGLRKSRVKKLIESGRGEFAVKFGEPEFLEAIGNFKPDVYCHHAAAVEGYKEESFDYASALLNNTNNLISTLDLFKEIGLRQIVLTGSVFEQGEGAGSENLIAVSPYGMSKKFTSDVFYYFCVKKNIPLRKFVIPNPFGAFEEPRFTNYLIKNWFMGKIPTVNSPLYVRDNIHVKLMSLIYGEFLEESVHSREQFLKINPSGYIENQGAFTGRFAAEMSKRLNLECRFELKEQRDFAEPRIRVNTDMILPKKNEWQESLAWDEMAVFYEEIYKNVSA